MCKLLYKKFPKHREIGEHFTKETESELKRRIGQKDLISSCIQKMMLSIQHMRKMVNMAIKWTGSQGANYMFFSGSTKAGQDVRSNTNHHVSDSTLRGCPHAIAVDRSYRESTTESRATPGPS